MDDVRCDIVVPVFNALAYTRDCIDSIRECTTDVRYVLHLVDDASDATTAARLGEYARLEQRIRVYRNPENVGFVESCNRGIAGGAAPYVALVNSDVIVTPRWLSRLLACAETDPRIAAVNPVTNRASHIDVPMVPGTNFYDMDAIFAERRQPEYPDIVTAVGFCLLLRRAALAEIGLFDPVYGHGYCEDSDLCMRLTAKGYRTVLADSVYVYHKGSASFTDRSGRYIANRRLFDARWKREYDRQFAAFRRANPLREVRALFRLADRPDPIGSVRETGSRLRRAWRTARPAELAREALRGLRRLPAARRPKITPEAVARYSRPKRLRVTYVLPTIGMGGGFFSVVQLMNELVLLGVEARIAALREQPLDEWRFLARPMIFPSKRALLRDFPASDITVATQWTTAPWVAELAASGRAGCPVYFLQDYEAWFYPESDTRTRERVRDTYPLIDHKIVKSEWLKELLERDAFSARKIRLGMDLDVFYPRQVSRDRRPFVLAMIRPNVPWRGHTFVIEALRRVKQAKPEAEIVLFGEGVLSFRIPFAHRNIGLITDANRLAETYSAADVFLDGSDWHGFGRPGLEAMACGAACVLTNVGGVSEYARDGENCLLVPPKQPEAFAEAVIRLLEDRELRGSLTEGGRRTARHYCHKREARETLEFFREIVTGSADETSLLGSG